MDGAPETTPGARFPLIGLLFGFAAIVAVHAPLAGVSALFDERPFLAGFAESRGAVLGMRWLPLELSWLGSDPRPHRILALALEVALLAGVACAPAVRRGAGGDWIVFLLAAWLVHPWRTESVVRLGARAILVSEALLAAGALLAFATHRAWSRALGCLAAAAAASGEPLFVAIAIPLLLAGGRSAPRLRLAFAGSLVAGAASAWIALPAPAPIGSALAGLELLVRPAATGLVHERASSLHWLGGLAVVLFFGGVAFFAAGTFRGRASGERGLVAACAAAALLAFLAAPALRPPRTGLDLLGQGLTPEAWLVPLGLLHFAAARVAAESRRHALPGLLLAALSLHAGWGHARRMESEAGLLDHSIAVAPEQVELRVARGRLHLAAAGAAPPGAQVGFATEALHAAQRALRRRPDHPAAEALTCLSLALLGKLDEARARSDEMLARIPDDWLARATRAELESLAGDDFAALRWLRAALAVEPSPRLRAGCTALIDRIYERIRIDLADRRFEDVRHACARLLEVAPEEIEARTTLIDTHTLAGDLPRALDLLLALHAERPRDAGVVRRLASLFERMGQEAEMRHFRRLLLELGGEDGSGGR